MREQATKCLQHGARRPWTSAKEIQASRRLLHSDFWHHGAGDLGLPTWCYSTMRALFESTNPNSFSTNSLSVPNNHSRSDGTFPLDFLYPLGTKAMLRRWSTSTLRKWRRQQRSSKADTCSRQFVSAAKYGQENASESDNGTSKLHPEAISANWSDKLRTLQALFVSGSASIEQDQWEESWSIFNLIPAYEKPWMDMIRFLSTSTRHVDAERLLQLVDNMPINQGTNDATFHAIHAFLSLGRISEAIDMHETTLKSGHGTKATDILLAYLLSNRQWALTSKVWTHKFQYQDLVNNAETINDWERAFFNKLKEMPHVDRAILSLARYIDKNRLSDDHSPSIGRLLQSLARLFFGDKEVYNGDRSLEVMWILRQHHLDTPYFYRQSCLAICSHRIIGTRKQGNIVRKHYEAFRKHGSFVPDQPFLRTVLQVAVNTNQKELVEMVLEDFKTQIGPLPPVVATTLMRYYARLGYLEKVDNILAECLQSFQDTSKSLLYPALHVRAVRADPPAVREKMEWIKKEFGHEPDQVCWGILMKAYQRIEDLDGVLSTFSTMLDAGYEPNHYSLITVMSTCADRGDAETVESLLAMGRSYGIQESQGFNDILVLALINQGRLTDAEDVAKSISATTSRSSKELQTRMWNQLLAAYAIEKNLRAMHRIAKQMQTMGIKFDNMTYAAFMRGYATARKTVYAHRILQQLKSKPGPDITSIHYAILINGYTWEERFGDAFKIHAEMLQLGIEPSLSSNMALLNLQSSAAHDSKGNNGSRILSPEMVEETFEEIINTFDAHLYANAEVQFQTRMAPASEVYPAAYYETLYNVYNSSKSYKLAKTLLTRYEARIMAQDDPAASRRPIRLTTALMDLHRRQGNALEVQRYFSLAKDSALRLAGIASTPTGTDQTAPNKLLPSIRRTLLARPFDIYQRTQAALNLWPEIHTAISDLRHNGFDLDNSNWNWYVQLRATRKYYVSAFQTCESYLMDDFRGWRSPEDIHHPKRRLNAHDPALSMMMSPDKLFHSSARFAHLKTIARLRNSVEKLKRASLDERKAVDILAMISKVAPRTLHAVETLPIIDHPVIRRLLSHMIDKDGMPIVNNPANNLGEEETTDLEMEMNDARRASKGMSSAAHEDDGVDGTYDVIPANSHASRRRRVDERVRLASSQRQVSHRARLEAVNSTSFQGPKYFRKTLSRSEREKVRDEEYEKDVFDADGDPEP